MDHIFGAIDAEAGAATFVVTVSLLQIYMEVIDDLLADVGAGVASGTGDKLAIRQVCGRCLATCVVTGCRCGKGGDWIGFEDKVPSIEPPTITITSPFLLIMTLFHDPFAHQTPEGFVFVENLSHHRVSSTEASP